MQEEKQTTTTTTNEPAVEAPAQTTQETTVNEPRAAGNVVAKRVVYYVGGVIVALLALRFVFLMLGANRDSGFVDFLYSLTAIFVAPFTGIFGEPSYGVSYFETSALVAMVVYGLITVGVGKLFTLNRAR